MPETVIDRTREYWDARPCNINHSWQPVGSVDYFVEVEARKYFVEPHILPFARFAQWKDKEVLEIGPGIGTDTVNFLHHGAFVTAVDLSRKSLHLTKRRADLFGVSDRLTILAEDVQQLSLHGLTARHYDLVYAFGVLHHVPDPARALRQMRKCLAPGGTLKLMVYHRYSWKVLWILLRYGYGRFWKLTDLIPRHSEAQPGCPVTWTFSQQEARLLLARCGFRVTEMAVDHIFPYRIRDYVQHEYVKVWYFRWMPARLFRWLERHFGWHLLITAEAVSPDNKKEE